MGMSNEQNYFRCVAFGCRRFVRFSLYSTPKSKFQSAEEFSESYFGQGRPSDWDLQKTVHGHWLIVRRIDEGVTILALSEDYENRWVAVVCRLTIHDEPTPEAEELYLQTLAAISAGRFNPAFTK